MKDPRHWLLIDGDCGLCRRSAGWVARRDRARRLHIVPWQEAPSPPLTPEVAAACQRAVHVVTAEGEVLAGAHAAVFVLAQLGWRRRAWWLGRPPLSWLMRAGYVVVARHRRFFGRWLFRRSAPLASEADPR